MLSNVLLFDHDCIMRRLLHRVDGLWRYSDNVTLHLVFTKHIPAPIHEALAIGPH